MKDKLYIDFGGKTGNKNVDHEFVPIIADEIQEIKNETFDPENIPVLPLRNSVLFPGVVIPISVARNKSLKLIREASNNNKVIGTCAQIDSTINDPQFKDLYNVGTFAHIIKILEMPDESTTVIIQGRSRFELIEMLGAEPYLSAKVKALDEIQPQPNDNEYSAIIFSLKDLTLKIVKLSNNIPSDASFAIRNIENPYFLINFICSNSDIKIPEKQKLLEIHDLKERGLKVLELLTKEAQMLELKNDIQLKVKSDLDKQQKEFLLHQQMKTIQEELGGNPFEQEVEELKSKAKKKQWGKEVAGIFNKELNKFSRMNPAAAEYSVQLNYLQLMLELPWNKFTKDNFDLNRAEKILDKDHFGLDKVKDRILEHLAVLKLKGDLKAPIICLYGPPGVGKTSLGKSIARALNRKFIRMSLGGLHDESEIRGHRKTYIGAMPGRIIQSLKKVNSSNPVFVLDEIDKVGNDFRGDPSAALLEVLDPEQNNTFHDNYLDTDFDLSKVLFIATANQTNTIHFALRDRMEMIEVNGYILEEKLEIAKRHLVTKQLKAHGVKPTQLKFTDEAITAVIDEYTKESGVRALDKKIAKIVRSYAKQIALNKKYNNSVTPGAVAEILGPEEFIKDKYEGNEIPGVVTGLAWTAFGGEILFVESSLSKGKGALTLTGNLGDVMKESAVIALEFIKSHSVVLKIPPDTFGKWNFHVHVPEGAIPKDGPSAGITIATSLTSSILKQKVRSNVAMTGEITLRGKILPVGGIKEKILAAKRAGIKEIILSERNKKDIRQIPQMYLQNLTFKYFDNVIDVLKYSLLSNNTKKTKKRI